MLLRFRLSLALLVAELVGTVEPVAAEEGVSINDALAIFLSQHKNISLYLRTCQSCLHGGESAVDGSLHGLEVGLQGLEAADLVIGAGHAGARDGHGDGADGGVGGGRDYHH